MDVRLRYRVKRKLSTCAGRSNTYLCKRENTIGILPCIRCDQSDSRQPASPPIHCKYHNNTLHLPTHSLSAMLKSTKLLDANTKMNDHTSLEPTNPPHLMHEIAKDVSRTHNTQHSHLCYPDLSRAQTIGFFLHILYSIYRMTLGSISYNSCLVFFARIPK